MQTYTPAGLPCKMVKATQAKPGRVYRTDCETDYLCVKCVNGGHNFISLEDEKSTLVGCIYFGDINLIDVGTLNMTLNPNG